MEEDNFKDAAGSIAKGLGKIGRFIFGKKMIVVIVIMLLPIFLIGAIYIECKGDLEEATETYKTYSSTVNKGTITYEVAEGETTKGTTNSRPGGTTGGGTTNGLPDISLNDIEVGEKGTYTAINDVYRYGIYHSSSGRKYAEWKQTTNNEYGTLKMFDKKENGEYYLMGEYGCNVYSCTALLNSIGIDVDPGDVHTVYKATGNDKNKETLENVISNNNLSAQVKTISQGDNTNSEIISVLEQGRGIAIRVTAASIYTDYGHWIVLADIRETQGESSLGYDVYVVTSASGHRGWQAIETVTNFISWGTPILYIED